MALLGTWENLKNKKKNVKFLFFRLLSTQLCGQWKQDFENIHSIHPPIGTVDIILILCCFLVEWIPQTVGCFWGNFWYLFFAIWCSDLSALTTCTKIAIVHRCCFSCSLDTLTELLECLLTWHMHYSFFCLFFYKGFVCLCGWADFWIWD